MKKLSNFYTVMESAFDIMQMSILWLICCLPVITIGASTAALYYTVNKVWKNKKGYVAQEFFRAFRLNLKPGILLYGVLGAAMIVVQLNLGIVREKISGDIGIFFTMLYWLLLIILWGIQLYVFPLLSRFDMPAGWFLKVGIYMCFRHIGRTIMLLLVTALAFLAAYKLLLAIVILPFAAHYIYNILLEPVLQLYMPKEV